MPLFLGLVLLLSIPQFSQASIDCQSLLGLDKKAQTQKPNSEVLSAYEREIRRTPYLADEVSFERLVAFRQKRTDRTETALVNSLRGDLLVAFQAYLPAFKSAEDFEEALQDVTLYSYQILSQWARNSKKSPHPEIWPEQREAMHLVWSDEAMLTSLTYKAGLKGRDQRLFEARVKHDPSFLENEIENFISVYGTQESIVEGLVQSDREDFVRSLLMNLRARAEFSVRLREISNLTFDEMGARLGITGQRAHAIYEKSMRQLKYPPNQKMKGSRIHRSFLLDVANTWDPEAAQIIDRTNKNAREYRKRMDNLKRHQEAEAAAAQAREDIHRPSKIPTLGGGPQLSEYDRVVVTPARSPAMIQIEEEIAILGEVLKGIESDPNLDPAAQAERVSTMKAVIAAKHQTFEKARDYWSKRVRGLIDYDDDWYAGPL